MIDLDALKIDLTSSSVAPEQNSLLSHTEQVIQSLKHGDAPKWEAACRQVPTGSLRPVKLDRPIISVGTAQSLTTTERDRLGRSLNALKPWRKGPFALAGLLVDSEWRSDMKWQRLEAHIQPLSGRCVLDVGCGNGYHLWRIKGSGADLVIGIDPTLLFCYQFKCVKSLIGECRVHLLPLRLDQLPEGLSCFDTVFSMGVLHHRRQPQQHLDELRQALNPSGELVLETLVSPPDQPIQLQPGERYARMRNIRALPTAQTLLKWLTRSGFADARVVSEQITSTEEQRKTAWMPFDSLAEALDPDNHNLTIEGLPAPRRAIVLATRN